MKPEIVARSARLTRLDEKGNLIGPSVPVEVSSFTSTPAPSIGDLCAHIQHIATTFADLSITMQTNAQALKSWLPLFYKDHQAYVRHRRYLARTHGHAPRRRNKHGRVGVRR